MTEIQEYTLRRGLEKAYADGRLKRSTEKPTPDGKKAVQVLVKQLTPEEKKVVAKAKAAEKSRLEAIKRNKREGKQPNPARCLRHFINRKGEYYQVILKRKGMKEYRSQKFQHLNDAIRHRDKKESDYELSKHDTR